MKRNTTFYAILIALFAIIGTNVSAQTPSVPSADSGHYYILYSTHNATVDLTKPDNSVFKDKNFIGNVAGKVLYQDPNTADGGKLKYGDKATVESTHGRDYLLWQIVKTCEGTYLKNKGSGKYVKESKRVSTDPYPVEISPEAGSTTQYSFRSMKNATDWGGFCLVYQNSEVDSWSPQQGENSWTAWIWEEQTETFTVPTLECTTLTVASTDNTKGTAYIEVTGRPTTTNIGVAGANIWAAPNAGYKFVKWSDGTNEYTDNPHNYAGSADVTFTATFEKLSTNSAVLTPTALENKFFYIQSAGDGQSIHGANKGDTRNYVLYANNNDARLKYGLLANAPSNDYALWFIEGGKLKNKGSKMFMTGSRDQDATGEAVTVEAVGSNGQVQIKTGGNSYTCAWANMNADRNSSLGEYGMTSWYLIYHSDIDLTWIGNSYITIGGKDNGGTWYKGSNQAGSMANFEGTNLGDKRSSIVLGGQVQAYKPTDNAVQMWYKVIDTTDDSAAIAETSFDLPKELDPQTGENTTNNSRHYGETTIDISGLTDGKTYRLEVWFKGVDGSVVKWDSNMNNNYKATFNKIAQNTGLNDIALKHGISVKNGVITVDGVENFSVFTVAGQRVNANQTLQAGVYVVKVENLVQKVVVK